MQNNHLIHEFKKNSFEKIRVELCNYRGQDVINIRVYYKVDEAANNWRPTQKGITMRTDLIPELNRAINKAFKEWSENINRRGEFILKNKEI